MNAYRVRSHDAWIGPYSAQTLLERHRSGALNEGAQILNEATQHTLSVAEFLYREAGRALPLKVAMPRKRPMARLQAHAPARRVNYIFCAGCVMLMACYFLPWFSTSKGALRGYEISYHAFGFMYYHWAPDPATNASNSFWLFTLIGIGGFFGLGDELAVLRKKTNHWWVRVFTALAPVIVLAVVFAAFVLATTAPGLVVILAEAGIRVATTPPGWVDILIALLRASTWGFWLIGLASAICSVGVFTQPGRPGAAERHLPLAQSA